MTNKILFIANWKMFGTKKTVKTINNVIKFSKRKHNKKAKIIYKEKNVKSKAYKNHNPSTY